MNGTLGNTVARAAAVLCRLSWQVRFAVLWAGFAWSALRALSRVQAGEARGGPHGYAISDLLLNYADGPARRGLVGEVALYLGEVFGGAPAYWGVGLMLAATAALVALAVRLFARMPDDMALLPLVLGPAGLMFFVYDPGAALRKEILGLLSVAMVLQGAFAGPAGQRLWTGGGAALLLASLFAHEGLVFLGPAFLLALFVVARARPGAARWCLGLGLGSALASVAAVAWIAGLPPPDPDRLCAATGLDKCGGAFIWIAERPDAGVAYVVGRRDWIDVPIYAALAGLAALAFVQVRVKGWSSARHIAVLGGALLAVAPLFALGFDWGRWIVMASLPLALCAAVALAQGRARPVPVLPPAAILAYLGTWAMPHALLGDVWMGVYFWPILALTAALCLVVQTLRRAVRRMGVAGSE